MTREQAAAAVAVREFRHGPYRMVSYEDTLALVGEQLFARLLRDPVRGVGPRGCGGFYSWNVIDVLVAGRRLYP